jgi:Histidine kinase-, DNA gyrase B-, and HSP90-like ATPase
MARRPAAKRAANLGRILLPGRKSEELKLTFAGNIIKHLGVQMYAGRPVSAIAELISNAWDADANEVRVRLPLDEPWSPTSNQYIQVADNGNGMTWDMVRDAYLDVGRDRRESDHSDKSPGGRAVQGRKGIGKLAGFGIADTLEVQTVHKSPDPTIKKPSLLWFKLDLSDLKRVKSGPAPVDVIYAGPVSEAPRGSRTSKGTTVRLRHLHERRAQNADRFHRSMSHRFLLIGPKFHVLINRESLREEEIDLQWRWPKQGWTTANVPGCGPVQYWIGFTPVPRKQNEGELSGLLIYTRGKVSQEETNFEISGGVTGQHGLRYLVGMVKAEWLDSGITGTDFIATPRDAIAWESPQGAAFKDWGQNLVRKSLADWAKLRTKQREKQIKEVSPKVSGRIERLAPSYKDAALEFVDKFKSVEMEPGEFEEILSWFLDALENATLRNILQKLRLSDVNDLAQLDDLLSKMEIRTAVTLLQIIESNLAAIDTLERMHRHDAKERGVLSKHLENNAWLIDPTWMLNKAEARVSTWINAKYGIRSKGKSGDADRVDFFCVAVGGTLHIVEIKRGAHIAKNADLLQAEKYRLYVLKRFSEISDPKAIKYNHVQSHLIAAGLHDDAESIKESFSDKGWVFFTTWDDLIERAKQTHNQFRQILLKKTTDADNQVVSSPGRAKPTTRKKIKPKARRKKVGK